MRYFALIDNDGFEVMAPEALEELHRAQRAAEGKAHHWETSYHALLDDYRRVPAVVRWLCSATADHRVAPRLAPSLA